MLGWETMSLGHSMTECRDEIGIKDWCGTILGRFTCKSAGSQGDFAWESESQIGGFGRETHSGSRPLFRPSGHTTSAPHFRSLQTSR